MRLRAPLGAAILYEVDLEVLLYIADPGEEVERDTGAMFGPALYHLVKLRLKEP